MTFFSFLCSIAAIPWVFGLVAFAEEKPVADWIKFSEKPYRMGDRDGTKYFVRNDHPARVIRFKWEFKVRTSGDPVQEKRSSLVLEPGQTKELGWHVRSAYFDFKATEARFQ